MPKRTSETDSLPQGAHDRSRAYTEAGVNLDAANTLVGKLKSLVAATHTKGVISDIGGFGGLFRPDLEGYSRPVLVAGADGVGTKLKLATAWNMHETIGIDLVAMSVNDILVQGAEPLFFLDYFATGTLDVGVAETVIAGVAEGCKQSGCALLGGETAEMPDVYAEGDYDLAGFCVGIVDSDAIVDGSTVRVGDVLIGLSSTGPHSNGYSLIRKIVREAGLGAEDTLPGTQVAAAEALLAPTKIYARTVRNILRDFTVKAMVHVTGGGFYDNIPRVLPQGPHQVGASIRFADIAVPPVFSWLKEAGNLSWPEMMQIFNCGVGYILIVDPAVADDVLDRCEALDQPAAAIGEIIPLTDSTQHDPAEAVRVVFSAARC